MTLKHQSITSSLALALGLLAVPQAALASESDGPQRVEITPYIEAAQVVAAELSPGDDVVTYSRIAVGVDAELNGRNTMGALSLRYERRISWSDDGPDGDLVSGIARVGVGVLPQRALTIEAGALAARTRVEGNGASILSPIADNPGQSNVYSAYAGPSVQTELGDLDVEGHYRIGYTKIEEPDALVTAPGADPVDIFDESVVHNAQLRFGARPGAVLPIGVGVGAGWYQEDIKNLDQRVQDRWVRADATLPVSHSLALIGGVGYEDVEVSQRDALRDGLGNPIVGSDGRYVTDPNSDRTIAYKTDGIIWDAGVLWRPSPRTSLEAHVGRRYGSMSYYGSLSYQPNARSSLNIGVYDTVSGFGGQLNNALAELPTEFQAIRNPISGDIIGCVDSLDRGSCLASALNAVRSSTFRSRGVAVTYGRSFGRWSAGVAGGYDNRKYIAAAGTVLESADGLTDETIWTAAYLNGQLSANSNLSTTVYASWFDSEFDLAGSSAGYGASAAYQRYLTRRLSATAAVSLDGVTREDLAIENEWGAAALLGLTYSF